MVPIVAVIVILFSASFNLPDEKVIAGEIQLSAVYLDDKKIIEISYDDKSNMTNSVTMEVEGLDNSFDKKYSTSFFSVDIPLSQPPQYGWSTLPVTFLVDHKEFGKILLKTEISPLGQPASKVLYTRP